MKFSIVNGKRVEAFPKGKGLCICCNQETVAKCGSRIIHHWAHKTLEHCDNWWENETVWHRKWKSYFPIEWQEVIQYDKITGEKHIADIKTDKDFVIEIQNSPMSIEELKSREKFYEKMLWIVNGEKFVKSFHILGKLPNPRDKTFIDIAFKSTKKDHLGRGFFKYSEKPDWKSNSNEIILLRFHDYSEIKNKVEKSYIGHHLFDWVKRRDVWFSSKTSVFIDFGGEVLWKLMKYDNKGLYCVRRIDKDYFIGKAIGQNHMQ